MDNNNIEVEDENTKRSSIVQQTELVKSLFEGKLRFPIHDISSINHRCSIPDFSAIEGKYHEIAVLRYRCIEPLLNLSSKDRTVEKVKQRIEQILSDRSYGEITKGNKLHRATVYRWLQNYEKSGRDIRSLLPSYNRCGGRDKIRIEKELEEFIGQAIEKIYLNKTRQSVKAVYEYIQKLILDANKYRSDDEKLPSVSYNTIRRRTEALNIYDATKHRYDLIEAEKRYGTKGEGVRPTRPWEWVEIDHTLLDFFVMDKDGFVLGRPWITYMIDKYSGYPLGFYISFNEPSYLSVMYCLYHAISPKDYVREQYPNIKNSWSAYGLPETLVVDNGKEFHGISLEDACLQLNINLQYNPPKTPWFKGAVERSFRELNNDLLNKLPGKSFPSWKERGSYDPVKNAVISLESLNEIIHLWFIDIYSQRFHRGIDSIPQELWDSGVEAYPPHLPCRKEDLIVLLGALETRTVTNKGIEFKGLYYNSRDLQRLRNSGSINKTNRIKFKYHQDDISSIHVFDERGNELEVKANNQKYTKGLSVWKHEVTIRHTKKIKEKVDMEALIEARADIDRIVENERKYRTEKKKSSKKISKWSKASITAGIVSGEKNETNNSSLSTDIAARTVNPNSRDIDDRISDIGKVFNKNKENDAEIDKSDFERLDRISSGEGIVIIESPEEKLTEERYVESRRTKRDNKNGIDEPGYIPKDESEFDLSGWGISYKTEQHQKGFNKKLSASGATKEEDHDK
ncbi:MAG TPA: Mu transposase C-terminal domain-containing protein [Candidatus Methanoperedens sp.]